MKRILKKSVLMLLVALLLTGTTATIATYATTQEVQAATKKGWVKTGKTFYYYKNGKKVKGWQKIGKNIYYFNKKNAKMLTGWQKLSGKSYYFKKTGKKGTMGKVLTGWNKLSGNYHYFNGKGVVQTGTKKIGKKTYFLDPKKKGVAYIPKTTKTKADDKTKPIYGDDKTKPIYGMVEVQKPSATEFEYIYATGYGTRCRDCNTIVESTHPQVLPEFNIGALQHDLNTGHSWMSSGNFNNIPIGKKPKMITVTEKQVIGYEKKIIGYKQKTVTKTTYKRVTSKPK